MRTSARASSVAKNHNAIARPTTKIMRVMPIVSPVSSLAAQGRQADAGRIEAPIDREDLPGDVAGAVAAQKVDGFGEFVFKAVAVEGNRIVIVGADLGSVHLFRHRGVHRTGR